MKHKIGISRKTLYILFLLLLLVVLALGVVFALRQPGLIHGFLDRLEEITPTTLADSPDAQAAVTGVTAFYTLDYTEEAAAYEWRVCQILTADGCEMFETMFAPGMRQIVEQDLIQTGCTAQAVKMVEEGSDGQTRIWQLEATLDHPWPGAPASDQVYAEVEQQPDGTWLMTHVLSDWEAARFSVTPTPAP